MVRAMCPVVRWMPQAMLYDVRYDVRYVFMLCFYDMWHGVTL